MKKSRTTLYHLAGNGEDERFNQTLLNMLGTMTPEVERPGGGNGLGLQLYQA